MADHCPINKIDSNVVGLRKATEECPGKLFADVNLVDWVLKEPNSYADFGAEVTTVVRNPIVESRRQKKGGIVDLIANVGFEADVTQEAFQPDFAEFLMADFRTKSEVPVAVIDGVADEYEPASGGDGYVSGDLLFAKNFTDTAANGLKNVIGTPTATTVPVNETIPTLVGQAGTISRVGFEFATGDVVIDVSGTLPKLVSTVKDMTDFGLIPGESVYLGGDLTIQQFDTETENGFCRVRSITTNEIVFDKTAKTMVANTGAAKTIRIFFGRVVKDEDRALFKLVTSQFERTLGAPDPDNPTEVEVEYMIGSAPAQLTINAPTADKMIANLTYVAIGAEFHDAGPIPGAPGFTPGKGLKPGNRPALVESDFFNTSSNFVRTKMALIEDGNASPLPLFNFFDGLDISIENNVKLAKSVGVLGGFDVSVGNLSITGSLKAYYRGIRATRAVLNNDDATFEFHAVVNNKGMSFDLPLIGIGNAKPDVQLGESVGQPLTITAVSGVNVHPSLDHVVMATFWDYLPDAAES